MLKDLNELILECRTDSAKDCIKEAVNAYNGGAYKASINATWVALVYDLISKFLELSTSGDKRAKSVVEQINNYKSEIERNDPMGLRHSLEFERGILDKAKECEFITKSQYDDLIRLREDRNKCSHPSFINSDTLYSPTPELARTHMRNVVEYVLSQPPAQGKAFIDYMVGIANNAYFPTETEKMIAELKNANFDKATSNSQRNFVSVLFCDCFEMKQFPNKNLRWYTAFINACFDIAPAITRETILKCIKKLTTNIKTEQFWILVGIIALFASNIYSDLDAVLQERIKQFIKTGKNMEVALSAPFLYKIKELYPVVEYGFLPKLHFAELKGIFDKYPQYSWFYYPQVIKLYINTFRAFDDCNVIAHQLLIPNYMYLNNSLIKDILQAYEDGNNIWHASRTTSLGEVIKTLYKCSDFCGVPKSDIDTALTKLERTDLIMTDSEVRELNDDYIPF